MPTDVPATSVMRNLPVSTGTMQSAFSVFQPTSLSSVGLPTFSPMIHTAPVPSLWSDAAAPSFQTSA